MRSTTDKRRPGPQKGRPPKLIDGAQVQRAAELFCNDTEIAVLVGCSVDTLTRRFSAELHRGRQTARVSLRRLQWQKAKAGNVAMLIFLGKQYLGQRDRFQMNDLDGAIERELVGIALLPSPVTDAAAWSREAQAQQQKLKPEDEK